MCLRACVCLQPVNLYKCVCVRVCVCVCAQARPYVLVDFPFDGENRYGQLRAVAGQSI